MVQGGEAAISAIGDVTEMAFGVLAEAKARLSTTRPDLDVAEHRIDPVKHRQFLAFEGAEAGSLMD
jgi:hypothetical protein